MNKAIIKSIFYLIFLALTLQSCKSIITTRKEVEYFNDVKIGSQDKITYYQNKIQINDVLSISVGELLTEAVQPYNLLGGQIGASGYLVNYDGNIVYPRLGTIALAGKTITEAENIINKLLIEKDLVKDPTVTIRISNARVLILGAGSGTKAFGANNTLTILEAIGTIPPSGIKNDIVLIREEDGIRKYVKLDITKIDLINGPYYYLKQNDVIYIKPNGPTVLQSGWLTSVGSIIGVFTSGLALYLLLSR
jgi:polysaccharide export outer membrane protein